MPPRVDIVIPAAGKGTFFLRPSATYRQGWTSILRPSPLAMLGVNSFRGAARSRKGAPALQASTVSLPQSDSRRLRGVFGGLGKKGVALVDRRLSLKALKQLACVAEGLVGGRVVECEEAAALAE